MPVNPDDPHHHGVAPIPADPGRESALSVMPGVHQPDVRAIRVPPRRREPSVEELVSGILNRDRGMIAKALTLMESARPEHRERGEEVLSRIAPHTGGAVRLGITGAPGAGKSTFIESFGTMLVDSGHRMAVLAVDPTSGVSGGSILGDKTRMETLSRHPNALIRPTAAGTWLGGVARGTRESILVCEAAGFDVVVVETVGVGQSETQVASMVDFFLLLMLAGSGDELQGLKKGIVEVADLIAINKADGDNVQRANASRSQFAAALRLLRPSSDHEHWQPRVVTCSALTKAGIPEIWEAIREHREQFEKSGQLDLLRMRQSLHWFEQALGHLVLDRFYRHPEVGARLEALKRDVVEGRRSPYAAADLLVNLVLGTLDPGPAGAAGAAPSAATHGATFHNPNPKGAVR